MFLFWVDFVYTDTRVIYAINAGGPYHLDSNGIKFLADPIDVGTKSDYGKRLPIKRIPEEDQIIYQTERWHDTDFHYLVPIHEAGDFVLVLKFAEVYFYGSNMKVFDVRLNHQHMVVKDLDIFDKVGNSVAYDEMIPFSIHNGKLIVNGEQSPFGNQLKIEFLKGLADNPKICAFYLIKGKLEDIYKLPPATPDTNQEDEEEQIDDSDDDLDSITSDNFESKKKEISSTRLNKKEIKSGRPAVDPYQDDNTSMVLPIIISLSIFIPTLFFMCRL